MSPAPDREDAADGVVFARNAADAEDIESHLQACADSFTPPLAGRVAIPAYAAKLARRAERFEAWQGGALIGLVALYGDAPDGQAFVTNVSVAPALTRRGIGRRLLDRALEHARGRGCRRIVLEVDAGAGALRLYRALGFLEEAREADALRLGLDLRPQCRSRAADEGAARPMPELSGSEVERAIGIEPTTFSLGS